MQGVIMSIIEKLLLDWEILRETERSNRWDALLVKLIIFLEYIGWYLMLSYRT